MESPGKDMRELEAQLDRLGTHQKLPGLQVTFADTGSGSATEAAGSTGDGAAGGAEKKELTKACSAGGRRREESAFKGGATCAAGGAAPGQGRCASREGCG